MTSKTNPVGAESVPVAQDERWMVVAITSGGDDVVLAHHGLGDFIDGLCGEDSGLEVPRGTGPGVFAVRNCKVYGNPEEEEREPTTIEGDWIKLRDLSPNAAPDEKTALVDAREAFLDLIANAKGFKNEVDGDANPDGGPDIITSTFHLTADEDVLREFWQALGFPLRYDEPLDDAITREVEKPAALSPQGEG